MLLVFCNVRVSQAELHHGALPVIQAAALRGEKLHRVFHSTLDHLVHIMSGFCLPEPFFSGKVSCALLLNTHRHTLVYAQRCKNKRRQYSVFIHESV